MREPDWVYRQRRQRAAAIVAIAVGFVLLVSLFGSALGGGVGIDVDDSDPVAIDRPDTDVILAREKKQIDALKERKRERRARRAARERSKPDRPTRTARKPRRESKPPSAQPAGGEAAPAPQPSAPAPEPTPAAPAPEPAATPAPAPQPQPQPSGGDVDPRFYRAVP